MDTIQILKSLNVKAFPFYLELLINFKFIYHYSFHLTNAVQYFVFEFPYSRLVCIKEEISKQKIKNTCQLVITHQNHKECIQFLEDLVKYISSPLRFF